MSQRFRAIWRGASKRCDHNLGTWSIESQTPPPLNHRETLMSCQSVEKRNPEILDLGSVFGTTDEDFIPQGTTIFLSVTAKNCTKVESNVVESITQTRRLSQSTRSCVPSLQRCRRRSQGRGESRRLHRPSLETTDQCLMS